MGRGWLSPTSADRFITRAKDDAAMGGSQVGNIA
jgi:hypothetical protein